MRAEEVLSASSDFRLREVVESAVRDAGGVVVELGSPLNPVERAVAAGLAAVGYQQSTLPPLHGGMGGMTSRQAIRRMAFGPLEEAWRAAQVAGMLRRQGQALPYQFEYVGEAPEQNLVYEGGRGEVGLRHVSAWIGRNDPELPAGAEWLFVMPTDAPPCKAQLFPRDGGRDVRSDVHTGGASLVLRIQPDEVNLVSGGGEECKLRAVEWSSARFFLGMLAGDGRVTYPSRFKRAFVLPKVAANLVTVRSLEEMVSYWGMPMARVVSATLNRMIAMARSTSGDVELAWKMLHGVRAPVVEDEGVITMFGRTAYRREYFPPVGQALPPLAAYSPGDSVQQSIPTLEQNIRVVRQKLERYQRELAEALERAGNGAVPREELFEEALRSGAALKIKVDYAGTYILLAPLVFRETEEIVHMGRRYPAGRYRMPDAVAFVPRGRGGLSVQVLTADGLVHPQPHVQWGPGNGLLCTGETDEARARNEKALGEAWEGDVAGWCDYLHSFLLSVWQDGRENRYWPLVACADRIGDL